MDRRDDDDAFSSQFWETFITLKVTVTCFHQLGY